MNSFNKKNPLKVLTSQADSKKWYQEGLKFECTGCGKCCSGAPGYVWIDHEEIITISAHLKIPPEDFISKYTRRIGNRISLIETFREYGTYDCIFLKGNQCSIYQARPIQCQTFPWWTKNLASPEEWNEAKLSCEGISDSAKVTSRVEIERQLHSYQSKNPIET